MSMDDAMQSREGTSNPQTLFAAEASPAATMEPADQSPPGRARLRRADRHQMAMRMGALDELLDEDHTARVVWEYVQNLDLSPLHGKILAVEGHAGREAIDPAILLSLWIYATVDGV